MRTFFTCLNIYMTLLRITFCTHIYFHLIPQNKIKKTVLVLSFREIKYFLKVMIAILSLTKSWAISAQKSVLVSSMIVYLHS